MANCGGLLGIFVGFSLLNLVTMIYNAVKMCVSYYLNKAENKIVPMKVKNRHHIKSQNLKKFMLTQRN